MTVEQAMNNIAERFSANATPDETEPLRKWFGPQWAIHLAAEYELAVDDNLPMQVDEPTFSEYADSKRAAREAAHALIKRTVDKV